MIKIVEGNILNATENIIAHQTNCMGVMGGGLAKQIRNKYPQVYKEYKDLCIWQKDTYNKGFAKHKYPLGFTQFIKCNDGKTIVNLFGQLGYGTDKQYTEYKALKSSLKALYDAVITNTNDTIAIPYNLGCGLAGGDWNVVYKIIEDVFQDYDVTIYKLV